MGSYLFANQYQNEVLPEGAQPFKKDWLRYYQALPARRHSFGFIDPALSEGDGADFTGVVVIDVDSDQNWFLKFARRYRINPTETVNLMFDLCKNFALNCLGVENVAYQKALLYMLSEEMKRRNQIIPVKGIHPGTDKTKETRIMGLIPRFEWGRIALAQGLHDFEMEYATFPRGAHDDLLDPLSQLEQIVFYPEKVKEKNDRPAANDPNYERWYIANLEKTRKAQEGYGSEYDYGD